MIGSQLSFGIFALVGLIMLILAGGSFGYLLWLKNKSRSSWMLQWFFLCVSLSAMATILTNSGLSWSRAFAPAQDAFLFLGGYFLVQFAHAYPSQDQPKEAAWMTFVFAALALLGLGYAAIFAVQSFVQAPNPLQEYQAYYALTPILLLAVVLVFLRRSLYLSGKQVDPPKSMSGNVKRFYINITKPQNQAARAIRNLGLAVSLGLIPVIIVLIKPGLPELLESFVFNFGVIMGIAAIMLVYLNYIPEPTTILARLIGIALVTVLLFLGLSSVWFIINIHGSQNNQIILSFMVLVLFSSALILLGFPLFLRTTLIKPLHQLLKGIRAANLGNLEVEVPVEYDDEIGFITSSFNRLLKSLNITTHALQDQAQNLEREVTQRTVELSISNEKLVKENVDRKITQANLDRQLRYEHALAGCSKSLLGGVEDYESQHRVLTTALEHLLGGAQASRAYIMRNFEDPDLGLCTGILAEANAPGISPHIDVPANQKAQLSILPTQFENTLAEGKPYGGPSIVALASRPELLELFLNQKEPLLSFITFPIFDPDGWWGFVGFDDCVTEREWNDQEILMLRTASEMIGNTLQRWQVERRLRENLEFLDQRVQDRTMEYAKVNAALRYEIYERQSLQKELEERLGIEMVMARISARLLSPADLRLAIHETMTDLGQMMQASRVMFVKIPSDSNNAIGDLVEWQAAGLAPLLGESVQEIIELYPEFLKGLNVNQTIYLHDNEAEPVEAERGLGLLLERGIKTLLLVPVSIDDHLSSVISIVDIELPIPSARANIRSVELIAGMLASLLRREETLSLLEEKVSERTREMSAFFDITMLAGEAQQLADFLQPALVKVIEIVACNAATVYLYDEEQNTMKLIAQHGIPDDYVAGATAFPIDGTVQAWIEQVNAGDEWFPGNAARRRQFNFPKFRSAAYASLRAKDNIQGLMSCYRMSDEPFDAYQMVLLNAIGEQLGMAVENYRLRLKSERTATIQERQRLARELHDAVSQSLYSLTLYARSGRDAYVVSDQAKLLDSLHELEVNSLVALKEMRLLLYQLRSLALEEKDLVQAIESRFNLVERRSGILADIVMDTTIALAEPVEQELFLLITEALNNALKHALASQVSVKIHRENGSILVEVEDDGRGFDPSPALAGMGLLNMRERADKLKGQLEISNQPDHGTRIRLEIPQKPMREGEDLYE